jgi:hypothetical protein
MTKEKISKLDLNEKILVQGLICTIMQRCSKDKSIPFMLRQRLKKAAKHAKDGLLPEERLREAFTWVLGINFTANPDDEGLDRLLGVPIFSNKVKKLYEECKKKAIAEREEFYKSNG